ncbi:hypothetical protein TrRE_jg2230, partial [Triparma retinervis]
VGPLYKQIWHPEHPSLSFVGLPHSVVPFPLFEMQGRTIAEMALKGWGEVGEEERVREAQNDYEGMGPNHRRVEDTHYLGDLQWDYTREIGVMGGIWGEEEERRNMVNEEIYKRAGMERKKGKIGGDDGYRRMDFWRDWEKHEWGIEKKGKRGKPRPRV